MLRFLNIYKYISFYILLEYGLTLRRFFFLQSAFATREVMRKKKKTG